METQPARLSNAELLDQLKRLVQRERTATAALVAHLAEVKRRKLYLAEGYGSMFRYCIQVLHLSEHATYLRLEAARMSLRFPQILVALASGDANLTSIRLLAPYLTAANCDDLLATVRHRTRAEIEGLLVQRFPRPDVPAVVRKLAAKPVVPVASPDRKVCPGGLTLLAAPACAPLETANAPAQMTLETPRPVVAPISEDRFKVQFTASAATRAKLRQAQDLLRHRIPNGDLSQVFDLALTALVEKLEKDRFAATARPRRGRGIAPNSRAIPADVKRAVWERDGGQCSFLGSNGHRCSETGFLELHHVVPFARGGPPTVGNIQLRCRAHNQFEALLEFGRRDDVVRETACSWRLNSV